MKNNTSVIRLLSISLLLSLGQSAKAEIPFVLSYFDETYSVPVTSEAYNEMAACNINVVNDSLSGISLDLAQAAGMMGMVDYPHYIHNIFDDTYAQIDARTQELVNQYSSHPALLGYRLTDEPHASEFEKMGYATQKLLQLDPDCLPWVNLYPNYASSSQMGTSTYDQYVDQFISVVQPKVLCFDNYDFGSSHFSNLATIREKALNANIPYWYIYQSAPTNWRPTPTPGQLRWQMYTALAYGFKGLLGYTYSTYWTDLGEALIDTAGNPTANYYTVQEIYGEIQTLAPTLNNLTSNGVYGNGGDGTFITNISGGDVVYGKFTDPSGKTYMMITNKDYSGGHTFGVTLNYSSSPLYNGLARVDKNTGKLVIADTDGYLSRYLAAGDGELFRVLNDTTAASTPDNLRLIDQEMTSLVIDWSNSTDPQSGIDFYYIYRDGVEVGTSPGSYFTDTDLLPGKSYSYRISAVNGEGLETYRSLPVLWATTLSMPGDANNDGVVDDKDATILAANWLTSTGASWADGDFNNDGAVDDKDASILAANWGNDFTAAASVPEPGMLALLAGMFMIVGLRRRK